MLTLDIGNIAYGVAVGEIATHDEHLGVVDDIATQQAMRTSSGRRIVGVPSNPFESRQGEDINIVESLTRLDYSPLTDVVPTSVSFPKPKPP
jgi:hypothetical protein